MRSFRVSASIGVENDKLYSILLIYSRPISDSTCYKCKSLMVQLSYI